MQKEYKKECVYTYVHIYIYIIESLCCTEVIKQHCKLTIFQLTKRKSEQYIFWMLDNSF